ncbi:protein NAP1-like isoform X3 [Populus alba x Populus x berolinensis]|nr:protein NAP1-like isoform X3 [Populus alba x Populus x berolinensis]
MQLFVKFATGIVLDSWSEANRSNLVAKLIFLDQLCGDLTVSSKKLPRSLCSITQFSVQFIASTTQIPSMPLALPSVSSRHSPAVSLSHTSPAVKQPRGDSTPQHGVNDSGYLKGSSSHSQNHLYDMDRGSLRSTDNKHRNVRRSGPLDYSSSRKVKLVEGSASGSTGRSPLPRFAVSRSGPLMYK